MSNSTDTTGCISHKRNKRFFVMYEDYLEIASVSKHQYKLAAFWRVLETKTNDRITYNQGLIEEAKKKGEPEPETTLWIEVPYSEYVNRALGIYKSSSFQVAAAESERLGFSASRVLQRKTNPQDPQSPLEDYKEYLYLTDRMQSVLDGGKYPTPIEINSPLLKGIEERQKRKAIENNNPPIEINSPNGDIPIENNSPPLLNSIGNKYTDKNSSKDDRNMDSVSVNTDDTTLSPSLLSDEELLAEIQRRHLSLSQPPNLNATITGQNDTPLTLAGSITAADGGNSLQSFFTPTEECVCGLCQRVYKNKDILASTGENAPCGHPKSMCFDVKDTPTDHNASSEPVVRATVPFAEPQEVNVPPTPTKPSESQLHSEEMPSSVPAHDESNRQATEQGKQGNGDDPIATGATKKARSGKSKKAEKPATDTPPKITPVLTEEEKAYKERCTGIYNQIVKRRGHEFNTGEEVKAERTIIRDCLAKKFNDAQIDRIHRYLAEEDKYWKLLENRIRISAMIIWRESNEISTLLKERREEEEKKRGVASSASTGVTSFTERNRAMKAKYLGKSIAQ